MFLKAANLVAVKLFHNEFIAFSHLSKLLKARDNGTIPLKDPISGDVNWVDERTEAILTFALCGFANFGSVGILLATLSKIGEVEYTDLEL